MATIPALQQVSPVSYHGLDASLQLLLLRCDADGNYASYDDRPAPESINRVELICLCRRPQRDDEWEALAGQIADFLHWEVVDDESDEILRPRPDIGREDRDLLNGRGEPSGGEVAEEQA